MSVMERRFEKIKDTVSGNYLIKFCILFFAATLAFTIMRNCWADDGDMVGELKDMPSVTWSWNPIRYKEGYALGTLTQAASRGFFFQTLEGQIKLGVNSTHGGYVDSQCVRDQAPSADPNEPPPSVMSKCLIELNPWPFSNYNQHLLTDLNDVTGQMIIGFFRTYAIMPLTESHHYLSKVYRVDPDRLKIGDYYDASSDMHIAGIFNYAKGSVEGRVVEASYEGVVRKRYELVVQTGTAGDVYRQISVSDYSLFEFIVAAMTTGRYLRIDYFELLSPLAVPLELVRGYNTYLRANRVEVIHDPARP